MAEYIDRDAFLTQERAWYCDNCDMRKNSKGKMVYEIGEAPCRACYVGDILDDVENCPAADVRPVARGKWEERKTFFHNSIVKCSLCGNFLDLAGVNAGRGDANFCPNCGADMREES